MRKAYALLGVSIIIVGLGAYASFHIGSTLRSPIINTSVTKTMSTSSSSTTETASLSLTSPSFENNAALPLEFTCDGDKASPELHIGGVPSGTKSLVLLMQDPDIPQQFKDARHIDAFDHWVVYNILPSTTVIKTGFQAGEVGINSSGTNEYVPPCPPPQYEPKEHRYVFVLYALSDTLSFGHAPTLAEVKNAIGSITIGQSTLIGTYQRH